MQIHYLGIWVLAFFFLAAPAYAQFGGGVTTQGSVTPGDAAVFVNAYTIRDGGTPGGSGTVNIGTAGQVAYYATTGSTVSSTPNIFVSGSNVGIGSAVPQGALDIGTGQLFVPNGLVGTPSINFGTNDGTGIYRVSSSLTFASNGVARFSIASGFSANNAAGVQLANTSAVSTTTPVIIPDRGDGTTGFAAGTQGNINAIIGGAEKMRITSTGVGINVTAPSTVLSLGVALNSTKLALYDDSTGTGLYAIGATSGNLTFVANGSTGGTAAMVIRGSNGNVGIGSSTPIVRLDVVGGINATGSVGIGTTTIRNSAVLDIQGGFNATGSGIFFTGLATGTNADFLCLSSTGNVLLQTSACTISQTKLKENIFDMQSSGAVHDLISLNPKGFNMIGKNRDPNYSHPQFGFLAEDVAAVNPRLAIYEDDMKTPKSWRQDSVISELVKGFQVHEERLNSGNAMGASSYHRCVSWLPLVCEGER